MRYQTKTTKITVTSAYPLTGKDSALDSAFSTCDAAFAACDAAFAEMATAIAHTETLIKKTETLIKKSEANMKQPTAAPAPAATKTFKFTASSWRHRLHLFWTFLCMSCGMLFLGRTKVSLRSR